MTNNYPQEALVISVPNKTRTEKEGYSISKPDILSLPN